MSECYLYLISPPKLSLETFLPQLEDALTVGIVKAFQLRLKEASDAEIIEASKKIMPICHKYEVAFIINDRADLVAQLDADGVHLGQEDMSAKEARKIIGDDKVIGITCHASKDLAITACENGADYVAFGAFYPTTSKSQEKLEKWGTPTLDIIEDWTEFTNIPCVVIGGITPQNCAPLVKAGADFIAVINGVWQHPKGAKAAAIEFAKIIND